MQVSLRLLMSKYHVLTIVCTQGNRKDCREKSIPYYFLGQTFPINTCSRFIAPILHCSFHMIELKELSAGPPVAQ